MHRITGSKSIKFMILLGAFLFIIPLSAHSERGDLNLNGLPFEVADAQLFEDFFNQGLGVFTIDLDAQVAATDINQDGLALTVADYVMMLRIIFQGLEANPADSVIGMVYVGVTDTTIEVYSWFADTMKTASLLLHLPDLISYNINLLPPYGGMQTSTYQSEALGDLAITIDGNAATHFPNHFTKSMRIKYDGSPASVVSYSAFGFAGEALKIAYVYEGMTGDVNLNGIGYEIQDAGVFTNYFYYGDMAFTIDPPPQIYASDVDGDGAPLTLQDFCYLLAVYFDYISPGDPVGPGINAGILMQESEGSVTVKTMLEGNVGALKLLYHAPGLSEIAVELIPSLPGILAGYKYEGDSLTIFVCDSLDFFEYAFIPAGDFADLLHITFTGPQPNLLGVQAAGYRGESVYFGTIPCNVLMGDFNEDYNRNLIDILGIIGVVYGDDPNPHAGSIDPADANCDCLLNLTDILLLINNIYGEGNPPCTCNDWLTNCSNL